MNRNSNPRCDLCHKNSLLLSRITITIRFVQRCIVDAYSPASTSSPARRTAVSSCVSCAANCGRPREPSRHRCRRVARGDRTQLRGCLRAAVQLRSVEADDVAVVREKRGEAVGVAPIPRLEQLLVRRNNLSRQLSFSHRRTSRGESTIIHATRHTGGLIDPPGELQSRSCRGSEGLATCVNARGPQATWS